MCTIKTIYFFCDFLKISFDSDLNGECIVFLIFLKFEYGTSNIEALFSIIQGFVFSCSGVSVICILFNVIIVVAFLGTVSVLTALAG